MLDHHTSGPERRLPGQQEIEFLVTPAFMGYWIRRERTMAEEYLFRINDSYTTATIPMERLGEYVSTLAKLLGEIPNVHFSCVAPCPRSACARPRASAPRDR